MTITRYRSVFVSDWHIGAKKFDSEAALRFLQSVDCEYLYLVGDIIDGWKLKKRWHWDEHCTLLMDMLLRKHDAGTKIIYIPGNHDEDIRPLLPLLNLKFHDFKNLKLADSVIHTAANDKKFLVLHGDQFDHKILRGRLSRWSDIAYDWITEKTGHHEKPHITINGVEKRFSMAKFLKKPGQKALTFLNNFETLVERTVKKHHCDGLICGHTHIPALKAIKDVIYANPGDWMQTGHTAIVEHDCGSLELLDWPCSTTQPALFADDVTPQELHPQTQTIIRFIRVLWNADRPYTRKTDETLKEFVVSPA